MHIIILILVLLCLVFIAENFWYIVAAIGIIVIFAFIFQAFKKSEEEKTDFNRGDSWYCHKCGTTNSLNDSKCIECGTVNKNVDLRKAKASSYKKSSLNYTPLSKKELNEKYPVVSQREYTPIAVTNTPINRGTVFIERVTFTDNVVMQTLEKYYAFDVETTGLSSEEDRIIEIGAVLFEKGNPVKTFASLVNPKIRVPYSATAVNHITNEMVKQAPDEESVYPKLIEFLGDALKGETIICAHNATFDMKFLSAALERLGYDAKITYLDTLSISRYMLPDLDNHKQPTVAEYLGIENQNAHRADSDAEVCGKILSYFIKEKLIKIEEAKIEEAKRAEARQLKEESKRNNVTEKIKGGVTLGFDYDSQKTFGLCQFDKYNDVPKLTELEEKAIIIIKDAFKIENLNFDNVLLRRHSENYLSILAFEKDHYNDFCRIKAGPRSTWVSLDVCTAKELQDDIRFADVTKRTQRHWKINLKNVEDFKNVSDLIIKVYQTIIRKTEE